MTNSLRTPGRIALVTGVSRRIGIGAAITKRLLAEGARVLATGFTPHDVEMPWGADPGGSDALLEELGGTPETLHYVEGPDFEDPATPERMLRATIERFGGIDIVVANHARSSHETLAEVSVEELDRCWAINARASALLARGLLELREPAPGGRLVLFTSGQHIGPMAGEIAYAISKGAIHQMTASLADALIDRGVTVNCINPGPVDTGYALGRSHRVIAEMFPAKRWGTTDEVASLVAFLCSDDGAWITGQVIVSEGGFRRWARVKLDRGEAG
jgi:3-oxoacyl-[acyl-carrier protein] reductase